MPWRHRSVYTKILTSQNYSSQLLKPQSISLQPTVTEPESVPPLALKNYFFKLQCAYKLVRFEFSNYHFLYSEIYKHDLRNSKSESI